MKLKNLLIAALSFIAINSIAGTIQEIGIGTLPTLPDAATRNALTTAPDGYTITELDDHNIWIWNSGGSVWSQPSGGAGTVTSFNTRVGAVTLSSADVTTALTFTPENLSHKSTDLIAPDNIKFPSTLTVSNAIANFQTGPISGDATTPSVASGVLTFATVNGSPGSFGDATHSLSANVNGKGLVTALSTNVIQIPESQVTSLVADLALKAPLASPNLTGIPTVPTAAPLTNSTQVASTAYVDAAAAAVVTPTPVSDATTLLKGIVKLAGDLGGTADLPTVPDLAIKAPIANPTFTGIVKTTGSIINLNDASYLMEGTDDPTSVATDAPISSTYRNTVTGIIYTKNDAGLTTNWSINLTTGTFGTTTIPNGFVASTTPATSASSTFVDVMSTTVTVTQTTVVHAIAAMNLNATTATAIAGIRVQINAVNGQTMLVNLADTTNKYSTSAQQLSASLTPGTYTVKAQIQRSSGTGTVNFANGTLFTQAQQGIINTTSPSRIIYVTKNGGGTGADGSWNKPYAIPSAAVATALLTCDSNNPIAIAISPGIGSTQYVDAAPVTITRGGISIFSMSSPRYKGAQVRYSGTFIVDTSVVPGSFEVYGIDITSPPGAAWDAWPAAIYSTGTSGQSIFIGNAVMNTNAVSRSGIYNDNPNAVIYVTNSDVKSGAVGSTNVPPVKISAGTINIFNSNIQDRQDLNLGTGIYASGGTVNMYGGNSIGQINKASNTAVVNLFQGANIQSGANPSIVTQATASTGSVGLFNAILNSSAANAVTGNETLYLGQALYTGTAITLDPNLAITPLTSIFGNIVSKGLSISNGHIISAGTAPLATPDANAGTSATCTVAGTDIAGTITLTTGSAAWATGSQCAVTFNVAYGAAPRCSITPTNAAASAALQNVYVTKSTTALTVNFVNPDNQANTDTWDYSCMQAN